MEKVSTNRKGSVLVAILLILMMISAIAMSLIRRSTVSVDVAIETKKSNEIFQSADNLAERVLAAIKKVEKPRENNKAKLSEINLYDLCNCIEDDDCGDVDFPENGVLLEGGVNNFCEKYDTKFFDKDGAEITDFSNGIDSIFSIKINSEENSFVSRAVRAALSKRPEPIIVIGEDMEPEQCDLIEDNCNSDYTLYCGDPCWRFSFFASTEEDDEDYRINGVTIIKEDELNQRKVINLKYVDDNKDEFQELNFDTDNDLNAYYFYLGEKIEDMDGGSFGTEKGEIFFRMNSSANYSLDSLDYQFEQIDGTKDFDF